MIKDKLQKLAWSAQCYHLHFVEPCLLLELFLGQSDNRGAHEVDFPASQVDEIIVRGRVETIVQGVISGYADVGGVDIGSRDQGAESGEKIFEEGSFNFPNWSQNQ